MKPVIIILIVLLIVISAYIFYSSTLVVEEEGLSNYQPRPEDINAAIQLTSMNGPTNFGGFPNQIGQQGIPMSQMQMYSSNPLIQQRAASWKTPYVENRMELPNGDDTLSDDDIKKQLSVSADALSNAFDANGKLKDEALIPLRAGFDSYIMSLKTNLTKDNLTAFLTNIIDVATTLKQKLNSGTGTTSGTK